MTTAMPNPLYEQWHSAVAARKESRYKVGTKRWFTWYHEVRMVRDSLVGRYAWAVPSNRVIGRLARLGPLVEIGAGNGYWASLIAQAGGDVIAYDKAPTHRRANTYCDKGSYFDVKKGGPEVLAGTSGRILFLCWPPFDSHMSSACLETFTGDTFVYVGEERGGCTGNEKFFHLLDTQWDLVGRGSIPQWPRMADGLFIYHRREEASS